MTVEECYQLGYIIKPHGLKGEVQIMLDVDEPSAYKELESVFVLQGQQLVPFFMESIALSQNKAIVKFEDVDDIDSAKALKGFELYLPLEALPELGEDDFYLHEIQGYRVLDAQLGDIGEVANVIDAGHQILMAVSHPMGKELLIPLSDELINKVDKAGKALHMSLPEGLIDIYLTEES